MGVRQLVTHFTRQGIFQKYETSKPGRLRTLKESAGDANRNLIDAKGTLWRQARHLDENHDLIHGVLNILVNNTVGPNGIQIEAQPRLNNGDIASEFVDELMELYKDWSRKPEVTWEYTRPQMERIIARSLYRDGEVFLHHVAGTKRSLDHGSIVPYSLELLESDYCPYDLPIGQYEDNVVSGIVRNQWGRPTAYKIYKYHPGAEQMFNTEVKTIRADQLSHAKLTTRIGQARGVTILAPVLTRLHDLRDYEQSEQIAARISAAQAFAIIKGSPDMYTPEAGLPGEEEPGEEYREFEVAPGTVWDDLLPGESVADITPSRPSALLQPFRDAMMKAIAAGTSVSYSTANRDYSGTYSAQRQEQVEQYANYSTLQGNFVSQVTMPMWHRFVGIAVASGQIKLPAGLNLDTLLDAEYRGPVIPWIDPAKEATANVELVRAGFKSQSQVIRERGDNPAAVMAEIIRERKFAEENELKFTTTMEETPEENADGNSENEDDSEGQGLRTQGTDKK
jgi:lambda family phage portal protein